MKIDDLVMLIKAGYTKADIEALGIAMGSDSIQEQLEATPEKPEAAPEQPEAVPEQPQNDDRIEGIETKLDYIINRFNYLAVQNSKQDGTKTETVEDILASVIK